jgi:hypothetical protein
MSRKNNTRCFSKTEDQMIQRLDTKRKVERLIRVKTATKDRVPTQAPTGWQRQGVEGR